ncbi:MAG: OsmC family protein [Actinomycetales bacterium]|nr:OsmC family protein [Actinomycetales bacterium]
MSATLDTVTDVVPATTDEGRATRLTEAGTFWGGHIAKDVNNAKLTYLVKGYGEGSVATRITSGKHEFYIDEPAGLAGDDMAASPVEVALGALIACQIVVYRLFAQNLGITIDSIDAKAEGDLDVQGLFGMDDSVRPGFSAIRLAIHVTGPEMQARYDELHAFVDAHCPVLDLFSNATPVAVSLVAN